MVGGGVVRDGFVVFRCHAPNGYIGDVRISRGNNSPGRVIADSRERACDWAARRRCADTSAVSRWWPSNSGLPPTVSAQGETGWHDHHLARLHRPFTARTGADGAVERCHREALHAPERRACRLWCRGGRWPSSGPTTGRTL